MVAGSQEASLLTTDAVLHTASSHVAVLHEATSHVGTLHVATHFLTPNFNLREIFEFRGKEKSSGRILNPGPILTKDGSLNRSGVLNLTYG